MKKLDLISGMTLLILALVFGIWARHLGFFGPAGIQTGFFPDPVKRLTGLL